MTERPIIFSSNMVQAILNDRKWQTRRVITPQPHGATTWLHMHTTFASGDTAFYPDVHNALPARLVCPYGAPGDLLWVRETWTYVTLAQNERQPGDKWNPQINMPVRMLYKADADVEGWKIVGRWSPSIFMPHWASRLLLRVTALRPERLLDITDLDARAEGFHNRDQFLAYWDTLNAKRGYPAAGNPWVWVIDFERHLERTI